MTFNPIKLLFNYKKLNPAIKPKFNKICQIIKREVSSNDQSFCKDKILFNEIIKGLNFLIKLSIKD